MIPFDIVTDERVYVAVDTNMPMAKHFMDAIPPSLDHLVSYHLTVILFDDTVRELRTFTKDNIDHIHNMIPHRLDQPASLDGVINHVIHAHIPYRQKGVPKLFVFSLGATTFWAPSILTQVVQVVWLHDDYDLPSATPVGTRLAIDLRDTAMQPSMEDRLREALKSFCEPIPEDVPDDQVMANIGTRMITAADIRLAISLTV